MFYLSCIKTDETKDGVTYNVVLKKQTNQITLAL